MKIGLILKKLRESRNMTIKELAKKSEISNGNLGDIERGKIEAPRKNTLEKISKALGLNKEEKTALFHGLIPETLKNREKGNAQVLPEVTEEITIPVYGDISAGNGRIIYGDIVDYYTLDKNTKNINQLVAIRVAGDSMEKRIPNGSQVLIRRGVEVESGNVGAFCIGEECYVKQLKIYGGIPVLKSFNSSYPEMEVKDTDEFITIGKVIECKIKF